MYMRYYKYIYYMYLIFKNIFIYKKLYALNVNKL
jgi:hypothetical protein